MITTIVASLLALLFVFLSIRIIWMRMKGVGPAIGEGDSEIFLRAVRAQANLAEYAPFFLILFLLSEIIGLPSFFLIGVAILFFVGRVFHAIGLSYGKAKKLRIYGTVLTLTVMLILPLTLLIAALSFYLQ